jgi:ATP-dependent Clp protease ATP-binding subunit ClpC
MLSLLQCAFPGFTDRALNALSAARDQAAARRHRQVTPEHVLLALAIDPGLGRVTLEHLGVDLQQDLAGVEALVSVAPPAAPEDHWSFSPEVEQLLAEAKAESAGFGHRYVGTEHLVLGLLRCGPCPAGDYLRANGVTVERFREEVLRLLAQL